MIKFQKTADTIHTDSGDYGILLNNFIKKGDFINHSNLLYLFLCEEKILGTKKKKIAVKRHRQFAHPSSDKLVGLLKQIDVNDKGLSNTIKNINLECDIYTRYRKAKPIPIAAFSMAKRLNEAITVDLKHWSDSPKVWLLHIIDHVI